MTPSRAQLIRDWLATQSEPRSAVEIAAAIGMADNRTNACWTVSVMYRDGYLNRTGEHRHYRYTLTGKQVRPQLTREEARKRRLERELNRNRRNGARPLAEHRAFIRARSLQRKAVKEAERQARREAEQRVRESKKVVQKIPKPRKPKAVKPMTVVKKPIQPRIAPPNPNLQHMESVAEFMARGGRIDRLPTSWAVQ